MRPGGEGGNRPTVLEHSLPVALEDGKRKVQSSIPPTLFMEIRSS